MVLAVLGTSVLAGISGLVAGGRPPTSLLLLPVLVAAYYGGLHAGLAATAAASFATLLQLGHVPPDSWTRTLILLVVGVATTSVIEAMHRARAQAEADKRRLAASTKRFAHLFASTPVAMSLCRLDDHTIVETNGAYHRLFGVTTTELVGRMPRASGIMVDAEARQRMLDELEERGWVRDVAQTVSTRDGLRDVRVWAQVVEVDGVGHVLSTFIDETAKQRAEAIAREHEHLFREVADHLDEVVWILSPTADKVIYMSPAYERVFGRSAATLLTNPLDVMEAIHPDDRAVVAEMIGRADSPTETSFRVLRGKGETRFLRARFFAIRNATGQIVRIAGLTRDVTDQLQLEEQVRQAQKLESLGFLAGGVAHDFNNILAVIGANTGMLGESISEEHRELIDDVEQAVKRGTSMTRQLLAFSRRQDVMPVVLEVNRTVDETRKMLRRMVGDDISFEVSLDPDLQSVLVDPSSLVQVLMNLAVNARDAMPTGGRLSLTTRNVVGTDGDEVLIVVTDSGCGMDEDVRSRIFEPFFTTKEAGKGTGLGLSVVHGIVRQAGGRVEVASELGRGTTFRIYFPAVASSQRAVRAVESPQLGRGSEKLLMVDDDGFVRAASSRALRARGYNVIEAHDGDSALAALDREGDSVTVLVTDVVMPGMDGRELAQKALAQLPNLRVLFTTGYADDAVLRHGVHRAEVALLEKPFGTGQLEERIRRLLDQKICA